MDNGYFTYNRRLGLLFAAMFMLLSVSQAYHESSAKWIIMLLCIGFAFSLIAVAAPQLLTPISKFWVKLGDTVGKLIGPLVLGLIFFAIITPIALIGRLIGRDELRLKQNSSDSYWIERKPSASSVESFIKQY